jgi:N-acyl-D-amino-acid deacylase
VVALAKSAAARGGVYTSHMRDEGEHVLEAITEAVTVGREAGMPVQLSHFKIDNRRLWGGSDQSLALVERYRRDGVDVVVDQYPYDRFQHQPRHSPPHLGAGRRQGQGALADPATRKKIADEMVKDLANNGQPDYSFCMVARFAANQKYEGKNISEINAMEGRAPGVANEIETIFSIMSQGGAQMIYHEMGDLDVERIMRYPFTAVASDGGHHRHGRGHAASARVRNQCAGAGGVRPHARHADARGCRSPHDLATGADVRFPRSLAWFARGSPRIWCCSTWRACAIVRPSPSLIRRRRVSMWWW